MAILVLPTSTFLVAQRDALRRLAPHEAVVDDPGHAAPGEIEVLVAFDLPAGLAARLPRLRFVAAAGAGVDRLLADAELPALVPVTRAVDPMQGARMAQYVAMTVLRWHRELPRHEAHQRTHVWKRIAAEPEERWTVGLLGYGAIGQAVAATLTGMGYPVRAWTRTPRRGDPVARYSGSRELAAFLEGTRVLACLLPLTADTRGLLDADALNAIAADESLRRQLRTRASRAQATVITPHPLEAARLLACANTAIQADRLAAARRLADELACVVVLKGSGSIVAAPGRVPCINASGDASLATAGTGDVLAGWLGGHWAQRDEADALERAWHVARHATWWHGAAAEAAARPVLRAADLIEQMALR